jgi:hypothetical protein
MAKGDEIDAICRILDKEWPEDTVNETVAAAILKAVDATRSTLWRPLGAPLKPGMAFKGIWSSTTWIVAWIGPAEPQGREMAWLVHASADYGAIQPVESRAWQWTSPAAIRDATKEKILTNELGMVAGDKVTMRQDGQYLIEAVFSRGVLMRSRRTGMVWAETNGGLEKYYKDGWKS